jgi:hypothetical protein
MKEDSNIVSDLLRTSRFEALSKSQSSMIAGMEIQEYHCFVDCGSGVEYGSFILKDL